MHPSPEQLNDVVHRIVEAVHPLRIILFGSAARGEMHPDSDMDIAIVVPEDADRRRVATTVYPRLVGVGIAVDIVVTTPDLMEKYRNAPGMVYREIQQDGRELYAA
jgi:predicted nucleotidyltransferase